MGYRLGIGLVEGEERKFQIQLVLIIGITLAGIGARQGRSQMAPDLLTRRHFGDLCQQEKVTPCIAGLVPVSL